MQPSPVSPVLEFEHDHLQISNMVMDLRARVATACATAVPDPNFWAQIAVELEDLRDLLLSHFAREEEGLFPFIRRVLPALESAIADIESTHDAICGALGRITHLVVSAPNAAPEHAAVLALFQRFDRAYSTHAQIERTFLADAGKKLTPGHATELARLIAEL